MLDIKLNEEQISKIKIISKEYSELKKRYRDLIKDIKKELNIPEKYPILGFLYYSYYEGHFCNRKKLRNAGSLILSIIVFAILIIFQNRNILYSTLCLELSLKMVDRVITSKRCSWTTSISSLLTEQSKRLARF